MTEREMRKILGEVVDDLDSGRVRVPRPKRRRLRSVVAPAILAAGLGLAGAAMGCDGRNVGTEGDGSARPDVMVGQDAGTVQQDAEVEVDGGPIWAYGIVFEDAEVDAMLVGSAIMAADDIAGAIKRLRGR